MGNRLKCVVLTLLLFALPLCAKKGVDRIVDEPATAADTLGKTGVTVALSIIPGGGQMYQGDFIHGGLFLGFEALFGIVAIDRWQKYHINLDKVDTIQRNYNSLITTPGFDTLEAMDTLFALEKMHYQASRMKMLHRNYSAWFAGMYVWNMFDAVGYSGFVKGSENPDPRRAAALSAIPFLGLGQLYNGKAYKAGLVWTMQFGCMTSAINFQRLMNESEERQSSLLTSAYMASDSVPISYEGTIENHWKNSYDSATRSRTMFMWYGVIFYLYGILDAYVDAHLHNFDSKFDIVGAYNPLDEEIGLTVTYDFGKRRSKNRKGQ